MIQSPDRNGEIGLDAPQLILRVGDTTQTKELHPLPVWFLKYQALKGGEIL